MIQLRIIFSHFIYSWIKHYKNLNNIDACVYKESISSFLVMLRFSYDQSDSSRFSLQILINYANLCSMASHTSKESTAMKRCKYSSFVTDDQNESCARQLCEGGEAAMIVWLCGLILFFILKLQLEGFKSIILFTMNYEKFFLPFFCWHQQSQWNHKSSKLLGDQKTSLFLQRVQRRAKNSNERAIFSRTFRVFAFTSLLTLCNH